MSVTVDVADQIDPDDLEDAPEPEADDDRVDEHERTWRALVKPQMHAVSAKLLWDDRGLSPYWGFVSEFDPDLDEREFSVECLGTEWVVKAASYHRGGIAPPEEADFEGGMYEYNVTLGDANSVDRDVSIVVRPGFSGAVHVETGDSIGGMPDDCPESIRVEFTSTNVGPDNALAVIRQFLEGLGVRAEFVGSEPHEYSAMTRVEQYVRLDRDVFEAALVGRGAVIDRLAAFGNEDGWVGEHTWDHKDTLGHHEEVRMGSETWAKLLEDVVCGFLDGVGYAVKGYHPDRVRGEDVDPDEDPLASPKFEVAYRSRWSDGAVPWTDRDRVLDAAQTVAWNVLDWAGVGLEPTAAHWVSDDYWSPSAARVDDPAERVAPSPLDVIERKREERVVDRLATTSLSDEQRRVLVALFDSDSNHYEALADRADVGTSTVYRLLDNLGDLLESMRGQIRFADKIARERVGGVVDRLRDAVDWGRDRVDEAVELADRYRDGPLAEWVRRHGIQVLEDDEDGRVKVDLGDGLTLDDARRIARSGFCSGPPQFHHIALIWRNRQGVERYARYDPRMKTTFKTLA